MKRLTITACLLFLTISTALALKQWTLPLTQPEHAMAAPGVWENVTPAGFSLNPNHGQPNGNYGMQIVLNDPARPSDFYAFSDYQGVWKSSNYGADGSWSKISTGTGSQLVNNGRNWDAVIDPNPNRNPSTPPTLYTNSGYDNNGTFGILKSTDGGVTWSQVWNNNIFAPNGTTNISSQVWVDMQGLAIDPNNSNHVLAVNHGNAQGTYNYDIFETTNGGQTWINRGSPAGNQIAIGFINSSTWIATAEGWGSTDPGSFVTTDSGATWTNIGNGSQMGKGHGNVELIHVMPNGTVYFATMSGIYRGVSPYNTSASWTKIDTTTQQSVIGTPNYLYASYGFSTLGTAGPSLRRAAVSSDTAWTSMGTPSGMTNGAMGAAVAYNGTSYIVVTANRLAGLWRYEEAPSGTPPPPPPPVNPPPPTTVSKTVTVDLEGRSSDAVSGSLDVLNSSKSLIRSYPFTSSSGGTVSLTLDNTTASLYFRLKAAPYLVRMIQGDMNSTLTFQQLKTGDINQDNLVNSIDFSTLNASWFGTSAASDLNADGIVNSLDFSFMNRNWFQRGEE